MLIYIGVSFTVGKRANTKCDKCCSPPFICVMRDAYMGGMCAFLYDISGLYGAMDMYEGQGQFISACLDLWPAGLEDAEAHHAEWHSQLPNIRVQCADAGQ